MSSVCFIALCAVALLVFKVVERVFGKGFAERREHTAQQLLGVLEWHKNHIEEQKPDA
jgi:hypothetical protein